MQAKTYPVRPLVSSYFTLYPAIMRFCISTFQYAIFTAFVFLVTSVFLASTLAVTGCSSSRTTTTVTKDVSQPTSQERGSAVATERTETVTETSSSTCGGILSCTVEGIGFVLALPFRAVGFVIDVIF